LNAGLFEKRILNPLMPTRPLFIHFIFCCAIVAAGASLLAQTPSPCPSASQVIPIPVDSSALKNWQNDRFGMFIHWGPVSLTGKEISWSRGSKELPVEKYDALYKEFNPQKFNADEWVAAAKAAGMKYIVLTCKHHDGFCLWDTKQTEYSIMQTPFKRDVVKELSEACKKQGIKFGAYYSTCDWHHPDFPVTSPGGKTVRDHSDLERYTVYLKAQISELLKNYGPLVTLWFDVPQKFDANRGQRVINLARSIQPDLLIDDRTGAKGDYSTPEQRVGGFNMDRPWESCMTISAHNHWAWGGEGDGVKGLADCIFMLVNCAGGDGNMLLNIGPRPDGAINPDQVARLKEIGGWLSEYGETIYGTRGGPYYPTKRYAATRLGNVIYLHIFKWNGETITLPPLGAQIVESSLLTGGKVEVENKPEGLKLNIASADQKIPDTIIKLTMKQDAMKIAPIKPIIKLTAIASSSEKGHGPELAIDEDHGTRWSAAAGIKSGWLEIDFTKPTAISSVAIFEGGGDRVKKFALEYQQGTEWKTILTGGSLGGTIEHFQKDFAPVTVSKIRLNIQEASDTPSIAEISFDERIVLTSKNQ